MTPDGAREERVMAEEWFEVAYINFGKAILHGRATAGRDDFGVRQEREVEIVLTDEQKRQIEDMNTDHHIAMQKLLRSFVPEPANAD
jgi:hypothetical protein